MIVPLGSWVLREACTRAARWRRANPRQPVALSVNISPLQLESDLAAELAVVLEETGMDPAGLTLEITENVLIEDLGAVIERLEAIRELGVRIALDDFGTGFSSLGYLSRLPIDVLKLDRSFVSQLGTPGQRALFCGIIELAHNLDLVAVAEGVETHEQLELLREIGCEHGQGYLFARPMKAEEMGVLSAAQSPQQVLRSAA